MRSCRNEREWPGTSRAIPEYVRRPSGGVCASSARTEPVSLRRWAECVACALEKWPPLARWDCRSLRPNISFAAIWTWVSDARSRPLLKWPSTTWYHGRSLLRRPRPRDLLALRPASSSLCRSCRDPWDWGQLYPPKTRLGQRAIGALPFPVHAGEFVAGRRQFGPDFLHDAISVPALEPTMNRTVVAELSRQVIPLTAAAHAIDNPIYGCSPVDPFAARPLAGWTIFEKDWFDECP
jgi:hypothetical protein